jgi:hypothetical protein
MKSAFPVPQRRHHEFGDFRAPPMYRTGMAAIEKPVQGHECLARLDYARGRKDPVQRQTALQPDDDKQG